MQNQALEKTTRMNLLLDFYESLLTEKQRTFLKYYIHDDFSLGEIAEIFNISRQAVYEHIKRAEVTLEDHEVKLRLLAKHELRSKCIDDIKALLSQMDHEQTDQLKMLVQKLIQVEMAADV